jgi:uncharacterized membrane protein
MIAVNYKNSLILLIILIAGFLLRLYQLDTYSIFFDEKSTLLVSQGIVLEGANQKDVFTASTFTPRDFWSPKTLADYYEAMTRSDIGNSPFYYLLLHIWMDIFGLSDFSIRFFSVIFSTLIIGLTYLFGKRFFDVRTGLIAASIVAIEPFFIAYSHQARNYSLTFFLTLLATYFFLQIIENGGNKNRRLKLYIGYALTAGLCLLSHFLTISVLLAHAIYAVFFLRSWNNWIKMGISAIIALSGVAWWMLFAGGQWTMRTLKYQAELYKEMADTGNTTFGLILPATLSNVFNKSLPVFTDLIIFTNGLTDALEGKRNTIVAIGIGLILILWYRFRDRIQTPPALTHRIPYLLIIVSSLLYNNHKLQFCILSVSIFALSFIYDIHKGADTKQKNRLWLLYMVGLIPTLFLILMSFKNGHTYGITQRYSGFSFPYVIIIIALLLQYFTKLPSEFRILVFVFMGIQFFMVGQRLEEFYQDRSVKYNYFAEPRPKNPFMQAAALINAEYQPGDTVLYPAKKYAMLSEMDRTFLPYSVRDAQLTNIYFPKTATYIQRIDTTQSEKVLLIRKIQKDTLEIINLKGLRAGDD